MPFSTGITKPYLSRSWHRFMPHVEALEDRTVPSGNTISGFVFHDLNNDGIRNPGEGPLANVRLDLRNPAGQIVAQTQSDANGYYLFDRDATINRTPLTLTRTHTFAASPTDFDLNAALAQFDSKLGTLVGVDLAFSGYIRSKIWAENLSTASSALINGTVTGGLNLSGGGVSLSVNTAPVQQQFNASKYDGSTDFSGTSGTYFGERSSNGLGSVTISSNDSRLQNFVGTGSVNFTLDGQARSTATGGGNLTSQFDSQGGGTLTVTYRYLLDDSLQPGNYTIIETTPAGFLDGKDSRDGVVLPGSVGTDAITVVLTNQNSVNNNFGEVASSQLCGTVYIDINNDGLHDAGEDGIAGVTMVLTGTDDRGRTIRLQQTTDLTGDYCFLGLRPGTYLVKQLPPLGFLPGQVNAPGSLGGQAQVNCFTAIQVTSGNEGTNYNFAWLKPSVLSGFVYVDGNQNGLKDVGERGLAGMRVILTGTDDLGTSIRLVRLTNAAGFYQFKGLRPGDYTLLQNTRPLGFQNGQNSVGSLGGGLGIQEIRDIFVAVGDFGQNYNFGKVRTQGGSCGRGGSL